MEIIITTQQLQYLADLVDWDTTGNQDDPLYLELMKLCNALNEDDQVVMAKQEGVRDE